MELPNHPFWDFSLEVHERPGVSGACLALQRSYGLDVNLLLFCCWAGAAEGRPLGRSAVRAAQDAVSGWQEEVVGPVWRARWRLKGGFGSFPFEQTEALRKALIASELEAEHVEQLQLAAAVPVQSRPEPEEAFRLAAVASNLSAYLEDRLPDGRAAGGKGPPEDLVQPLEVLLAGVFPGRDREALRAELVRALNAPL